MKKTIIIVIAIFVIIQFFRVDTTNPKVDPNQDFIKVTNPPTEVSTILKNTCYDCHSDETKYPWYFNVAPVSWILKNHVNEGRRHVNFSTWGSYDSEKQAKRLDHCIDEINEGEMPLGAYAMIHSEANLNDAQKNELVGWFKAVKDSL